MKLGDPVHFFSCKDAEPQFGFVVGCCPDDKMVHLAVFTPQGQIQGHSLVCCEPDPKDPAKHYCGAPVDKSKKPTAGPKAPIHSETETASQ